MSSRLKPQTEQASSSLRGHPGGQLANPPLGDIEDIGQIAAYMLDMIRPLASLAKAKDLEMLHYLLDMAVLEAAEIRSRGRAKPAALRRPRAPGGERSAR